MKRTFLRAAAITAALSMVIAAGPAMADDDDDYVTDDSSSSSSSDEGTSERIADDDEEEVRPPPRKRKGKKARRRLASAEAASSYSDLKVSRKWARPKEIDVRLAGLVGMSAMSSTFTDPSFVNLALELNVDVRAWKYAGLELDVNGDLLTGKFADGTSASSPSLSKQARGGLINAKGQYPFWAGGSVRMTPKGGMGFGLQTLDYASDAGDSSAVNVFGAFFVVGLDVEPTPKVLLYADYARSLGAGGTESRSSAAADVDLFDASYDRIRLGGYYRLNDGWTIGAQIMRRSLSYTGSTSLFSPQSLPSTAASGGSGDNTSYQFLGMLGLEL